MDRRHFLYAAAVLPAVVAVGAERSTKAAGSARPIDVQQFHAMRKLAKLKEGRIAYVERGQGPAALFLHGHPLNGFQWRGALDRLSHQRRCIAPDLMGLGYSEVLDGADIGPEAQVAMLAGLLDSLGEKTVDLIGNDSGGAVAQLFAVRHPQRVRTMLLTNCDTAPDSPPQILLGLIEDARAGVALEKTVVDTLKDYSKGRAGLGSAFTNPNTLSNEVLEVYLRAYVQSPLRKKQYNESIVVLAKNVLQPIEADLKRLQTPVRIVWGTGDTIFKADSPDYLDKLFPKSRGVHRVEGAKLFWPEEFPDVIAEEARKLWGV